jgi:hypothetical protein
MKPFYTFALVLATGLCLLAARADDTVYFPPGTERWYPRHLAAMKEPSLYEQRTNTLVEQYRFLWLRSFRNPIAVRVRKDDAGITLRVVWLSGGSGYKPGKIERDESFSLTKDQWGEFLKLLDKASFWDMPTDDKVMGRDGSQWILEGQSAGKYHHADRWTPSEELEKRRLENFVACCRYLLKLAKVETPKGDDY